MFDPHAYGDLYQAVRVNGETIATGGRDCESRWSMIGPHLADCHRVLDFGSNGGYFAQRQAEQRPDGVVWSMECEPDRYVLQTAMLAANGTQNVALTTKRMALTDWLKISSSINPIDCVLSLNSLEYYTSLEALEIIHLWSHLSPRLILEMPDPAETGAAGWETFAALHPIDDVLRRFYPSVELLGETPATTDPTLTRKIWLAKRTCGLFTDDLLGYIGGNFGRRHSLTHYNNRWVIDGAHDVTSNPALNLFNLLYFGLAYPNNMADGLLEKYSELIGIYGSITDIHPRNVLFTVGGLVPIDYLEQYGNPVVYSIDRPEWEGDFTEYFSDNWRRIAAALSVGNAEPFALPGLDKFQ